MIVLPPEILDHIFDLVSYTDYNSLGACAKAHPFLSDPAERHIFSDIQVYPGRSYQRSFNASELSELFRDKPRRASYVDSLIVEFGPNLGRDNDFLAISSIVAMVLRLKTINLKVVGSSRDIAWSEFPTYFRDAFTNCLGWPSMERVFLSGIVKFPITALDQCTTVSLDGTFDFSNSCSKSYPKLESLSIFNWSGMFPNVTAWVKKTNLRHLDIRIPIIDECRTLFQVCPAVTALTLDLGHNLQTIHYADAHPTAFTTELTLLPLTNLQQLTIYAVMSFSGPSRFWEHHTSLPFIVQLLKTAPAIKHLSLHFRYKFRSDHSLFDIPSEVAHIAEISSVARIHLYVSAWGLACGNVLPSRILSLLERNDTLMDMVGSGVLILRGELHACRYAFCPCPF